MEILIKCKRKSREERQSWKRICSWYSVLSAEKFCFIIRVWRSPAFTTCQRLYLRRRKHIGDSLPVIIDGGTIDSSALNMSVEKNLTWRSQQRHHRFWKLFLPASLVQFPYRLLLSHPTGSMPAGWEASPEICSPACNPHTGSADIVWMQSEKIDGQENMTAEGEII